MDGNRPNSTSPISGADSADTAAVAVPIPGDLQSQPHRAPHLVRTPKTFSTVPASVKELQAEQVSRVCEADHDQSELRSKSSDIFSEDSHCQERSLHMTLTNQDNRISTSGKEIPESIQHPSETHVLDMMRDITTMLPHEVNRYSTIHSQAASLHCAESTPEALTAVPCKDSQLMTLDEFRRSTDASEICDLALGSRMNNNLESKMSPSSALIQTIFVEIDKLIEDYSFGILEAASEDEFGPSTSLDSSSLDCSQVALDTSSYSSMATSGTSLVVAETYISSFRRESTHSSANMNSTSNVVTGVDPLNIPVLKGWTPPPPPIPERSLLRPRNPTHLAYLRRSAGPQAPLYVPKKQIGTGFCDQWDLVDFGPVSKPRD